MTTTTGITEPGVYDLPAEVYFADPVEGGSLSSTGARRLLPPHCPALFDHERRNGQQHRPEFDFGHAAHREVLGVGQELRLLDHPDFRSKAARDERDEAYADGAVPLLAADYERVQAMAEAIRQHPVAARLFAPGSGRPEQTLIWRDADTGVMRRAMLDWLPETVPGRRLIVPDYKTCQKADPESIARSVHTYGYHQQGAQYIDGVKTLGLAPDGAAMVFAFQEKTAPYLVHVVELDAAALQIGRKRNRRALQIYAECTATGVWPGYADDSVSFISLPAWAEKQEQNA